MINFTQIHRELFSGTNHLGTDRDGEEREVGGW